MRRRDREEAGPQGESGRQTEGESGTSHDSPALLRRDKIYSGEDLFGGFVL